MDEREFRTIMTAEIRRNRPEHALIADQIVDRLLSFDYMKHPEQLAEFIESYRQAVAKGVGSGTY